MIAHQRIIRDQHAKEHDPLIEQKMALAQSFEHASVKEISNAEAKTIILRYEWIGNMGVTDYAFGLYFGEHLAGVECFGRTAGTNTAASVCGKEYAHLVKVLNRGACVHWAHPHSASHLIPRACDLMAEKGFNIFVAYSDADAGEIGTVYQSSGWLYCGTTNSMASGFVWAKKPIAQDPRWGTFKDGKVHDERNIQHSVRGRQFANRKVSAYHSVCTRRERRQQMIDEGFLFVKTQPKGRYVTFAGDKKLVKELRAALQWETFEPPTRDGSERGVCPQCGAVFPSNRQRRKHFEREHAIAEEQIA